MADYKVMIENLVADALTNKLPGLTKTVTLHYFVSDGGYNAETDSNSPVFNAVPGVVCVAAKPTFADVENYKIVFADTKLIIPGKFMPSDLQPETDKVTLDGLEWQVKRCVGVPGRSVFLVFVNRT